MVTICICYMYMHLKTMRLGCYHGAWLPWCMSHLLACEFLHWLLYDIAIFLRLDPAHVHVPQYLQHGICPKKWYYHLMCPNDQLKFNSYTLF